MHLSSLQRFILVECLDGKKQHIAPRRFQHFYTHQQERPSKKDQQNSITKSLERLIDNGLMIGYGRRTPEKWFIDEVSLTSQGRKRARTLLGKQQLLPFNIHNHANTQKR